MARGNHINGIKITERFGLIIVEPKYTDETFRNYDKIKVSAKGLLCGYWLQYRDHLGYVSSKRIPLIKRTDKYLFFKNNCN
jgi:hypothetical protein